MQNQFFNLVQTGWTLLRLIAVISSSIVTILSSLIPLFLHTSLSPEYLILLFILLSIVAIIVHGGLTHLFNDYADFLSDTDAKSPAILSGGSRVIQKKLIQPENVIKLGKWIAILLLIIAGVMAVLSRYDLTILIVVGVWSAYSYSLPPLQLSYRPFVGEWFSLFPAIFFLGLAGPWIALATIPLWAYQNALINAFVCMGWVMVHHIPDIKSDQMATPVKRTSVVWFVDNFGIQFSRFPSLLYYSLAFFCSILLLSNRSWTGLIVISLLLVAFYCVYKIQPNNVQQVTNIEKTLLLLAVVIAITLGIF